MHKFSAVWALKKKKHMLSVISTVFCMHISIFYIVFLHAGFVKDSEMLMELESFFLQPEICKRWGRKYY